MRMFCRRRGRKKRSLIHVIVGTVWCGGQRGVSDRVPGPQQFGHIVVSHLGGDRLGTEAALLQGVWVSSIAQQDFNDVNVTVGGCKVKSGRICRSTSHQVHVMGGLGIPKSIGLTRSTQAGRRLSLLVTITPWKPVGPDQTRKLSHTSP
jgi:hypothetical protein